MIRIGVRAHDFGRYPAEELARRIAAKGLRCVQLALGKAIAGLEFKPGTLNPGLAWEVGQAFQRQGVQIAVLGCYINPIHPDPATRAELLGLFKEHLRFARDFGCGLVALETGSCNADYSPHPDNQGEAAFQTSVRSLSELVAEAERFGVVVGIEAVTSHVVSSPARMRRMLDSISSNNLQVVFDPVNLLSPQNWKAQRNIFEEAFELFGDRIAIIHAKDFLITEGMQSSGSAELGRAEAAHCAPVLKTVPAGQGRLDYNVILKFAQQRKPGISILLEEAGETAAEACIRFLRQKASL